ncbi:hypothetical protein Fmac_015411 [Flemingia macrophylla]|uniref:Neprosin PEP catalytic domain-containing protein n=1 Tax=Flemingia macrophylla TaxID=520843 RepID=A0ABD1MEH2_9FABA
MWGFVLRVYAFTLDVLEVFPDLYGDSQTRLTGYWGVEGNPKLGCFDTLCPGFVQIHHSFVFGIPLEVSKIGVDEQFYLNFIIQQVNRIGDQMGCDGVLVLDVIVNGLTWESCHHLRRRTTVCRRATAGRRHKSPETSGSGSSLRVTANSGSLVTIGAATRCKRSPSV